MSADLHVKGVRNETYIDEPIETISTIGKPPGIDVTMMRDDDRLPEYVRRTLYEDELVPRELLLLADSLERAVRECDGMDVHDRAYYTNIVSWLRHFGSERLSVRGIH